ANEATQSTYTRRLLPTFVRFYLAEAAVSVVVYAVEFLVISKSELQRVLHFLLQQRHFQNFVDGIDIVERQSLQVVALNLADITLVLRTQNHFFDPASPRSQNLLFDTSYRQHFSAKRDFSCHGQPRLHLALRVDRSQRCKHGNYMRGSIFRKVTRRNVNVNVVLLKHSVVNSQRLCI